MKIIVLISTMKCKNVKKLVNKMNIQTDCIVVDQCDCKEESKEIIENGNDKIIYIKSTERGLSRSRNLALKYVPKEFDVIIFSDDDIYFYDGYDKAICDVYSNPKIDGCVFNVERVSGRLNKNMGKKINKINLFRACSVSMTFRYKSIQNLKFNVNYGAGSGKYVLGEENLFINDCLNKKMTIVTNKFVMCKICDTRPSTWYKGMNEDVFLAKGACFKLIYPYLYLLFDIDFSIRKYKEYKNNLSFKKAISTLIEGNKLLKSGD